MLSPIPRLPLNGKRYEQLFTIARLALAFLFLLALFLHPAPAAAQLSTEDHLADPGFWPTQDLPTRDNITGPAACTQCHAAKAAAQKQTPMGRAAMSPSLSEVLHAAPLMQFAPGKYRYKIEASAGQTLYSTSLGKDTLSFPLLWAFGTGRVGQSYLFKKHGDDFFEARVTWFESLKNIGFTPFRALLTPSSLEEAMERPVPHAEVMRCFGCHTTASSIGGQFDETHLIPGVTCEACHGPGAAHVEAMKSAPKDGAKPVATAIFNSSLLSPNDAVDFCGACHGTWWDGKLVGVKGVSSARSAPFRLVTSKCWGKGDVRLTCTACHDPHQQLQTDPAAYDDACLNCHAKSLSAARIVGHDAPACRVATNRCITCHMVKVYVPEMHDNFTDHRIRIARAGEPFPD
jgi:hypothetical protein